MLYLAIDQHRKQLTVNLRNENGDVVLKRQVSTQWGRVRTFFDDLLERSGPGAGFVAILEVCGFNHWLIAMLREYDCRDMVLVQPDTRSKKKTDRRDANSLGKRKRMGAVRTRTVNKVHHILLKHNLHQECPLKDIKGKKARRWLAELPLDEIDRMEMDLLLAQWELWDTQLAALEKKLEKRQAADKKAAIVATMPGAGAYSSLALASRIGSIERFPRPSSLANYWGLTPGCRNSGDITDRLGSITKQGSPMARFILGQMVLHVLRRDAVMKAWYKRIKHRRGSKIARVAVMRRLATVLWHMLKHKESYAFGGATPLSANPVGARLPTPLPRIPWLRSLPTGSADNGSVVGKGHIFQNNSRRTT